MKVTLFKSLSLSLILMSLLACAKPSGETVKESPPSEENQKLRLKTGTQIVILQSEVDPEAPGGLKETFRTLTIESPSGAEGLGFSWNSGKNLPLKAATPEASPPAKSQAEPRVRFKDLMAVPADSNGRLALPNLAKSKRMTLPLFWPAGDLFLSNSSGIWLSDQAYQELKKEKKTTLSPGLFQNPLMGPAEGIPLLEWSLASLATLVGDNPESLAASQTIERKGRIKKIPIKINGKDQEVEVMEAGNDWLEMKILNNAQNPLILDFNFLPHPRWKDFFFTPAGLLKKPLEYRVVEIFNPNSPVIRIP